MKARILIAAALALSLTGCQSDGESSDGSALRFICRTGGVSLGALATVKASLGLGTQAIITQIANGVLNPFCGEEVQPPLDRIKEIGLTVAITQLAVYLLAPQPTVMSFAAVEPAWPEIRVVWQANLARWNTGT